MFNFRRFSSLLVPVPQTFKIVALILTSIDFENTLPIKSDVLNGHHVSLEFPLKSELYFLIYRFVEILDAITFLI